MSFDLFFDVMKTKGKQEKPEEDTECEHVLKCVKNEQVCDKCGLVFQCNFDSKEWNAKKNGFFTRTHFRKNTTKTIYKDIANMNFSKDVVDITNTMYKKVTNGKIFRGRTRKSIIFACVMHAFKVLGQMQNHDKILKQFHINKKSALFGLRFLSLNMSEEDRALVMHNKKPVTVIVIEEIMSKFSATQEQKQEVIEMFAKVKNKSMRINRSRPKSLGGALIFYWIKKNEKDVSIAEFSEIAQISELTIIRLVNEITRITAADSSAPSSQ